MKLFYALATAALLASSAVHADTSSNGFAAKIAQSYSAAGYSNIVVDHIDGNWIVTADYNGVTQSFLVDKHTGTSTVVDLTLITGHRHGSNGNGMSDDGPLHDVGDDHGVDANHDIGDDHGSDANDDVGDDHGADSNDDDGDDNGDDSSDDDNSGSGGDNSGKGED